MAEHEEAAITSLSEKPSKEMEEGEIEDFENDDQGPPSSDQLSGGRKIAERHLLENSWTFWFDNPSAKSKQVAWGSSLRPVHTFSTVEDFWRSYPILHRTLLGVFSSKTSVWGLSGGRRRRSPNKEGSCTTFNGTFFELQQLGLYNNIPHPSKLVVGADFYCFKHKIEPKWEDPVCDNGGKWTISCTRGKSDTFWLYTLLAMIGEQFDYGDEICGAVVNVRGKQERISIWTKNASNEVAQLSIGKQWKEFLDYNESIGFIVHEDAKRNDRSAKNRYSV